MVLYTTSVADLFIFSFILEVFHICLIVHSYLRTELNPVGGCIEIPLVLFVGLPPCWASSLKDAADKYFYIHEQNLSTVRHLFRMVGIDPASRLEAPHNMQE